MVKLARILVMGFNRSVAHTTGSITQIIGLVKLEGGKKLNGSCTQDKGNPQNIGQAASRSCSHGCPEVGEVGDDVLHSPTHANAYWRTAIVPR